MRFLIIVAMAMLISCSSKEKQEEKEFINYGTPLKQIVDEKGLDKSDIQVEISKSEYTLYVKHKQEILKSYPVVLGPDPVNDKLMEGDGCTPEGRFRIRDKYPHAEVIAGVALWPASGFFYDVNKFQGTLFTLCCRKRF